MKILTAVKKLQPFALPALLSLPIIWLLLPTNIEGITCQRIKVHPNMPVTPVKGNSFDYSFEGKSNLKAIIALDRARYWCNSDLFGKSSGNGKHSLGVRIVIRYNQKNKQH